MRKDRRRRILKKLGLRDDLLRATGDHEHNLDLSQPSITPERGVDWGHGQTTPGTDGHVHDWYVTRSGVVVSIAEGHSHEVENHD